MTGDQLMAIVRAGVAHAPSADPASQLATLLPGHPVHTAIVALSNHAEAMAELVRACERYKQDPTGFMFDCMCEALAAVHAIPADGAG